MVTEALLRKEKHASLQETEDTVFEEKFQCTMTTINFTQILLPSIIILLYILQKLSKGMLTN